MPRFPQLFQASIGKKLLMSLTGLALVGFLFVHLAGNLLIFAGDEAFSHYAAKFESNPALLYTAEAGLILLFAVHIGLALRTASENRAARGGGRYAIRASMGQKTPGSSTMVVTGVLVAIFLVVHLLDFRLNPDKSAERLAQMVRARLSQPAGIAIYLVGVLAVGLHLSHAVRSAFQTLGLDHPRYTPALRWLGLGVSFVLCVGFALFPILLGLAGPSPTGSDASAQAPAVESPAYFDAGGAR